MPITFTRSAVIRGITSCVPASKFDNLADSTDFDKDEVEKVVAMAGVKTRHLADESICSSDLCLSAAKDVLHGLQWSPETVDVVIMLTQSPGYFLPSTACRRKRLVNQAGNALDGEIKNILTRSSRRTDPGNRWENRAADCKDAVLEDRR
jgi:3-oxoacyl-[acyl-carrier-protein] synthase III